MSDLKLAVIGIDHRHIYGQLAGMLELGCTCKGWWTEGDPQPVEGFEKRFPDVPRVADRRELLDDPEIDLVLIADIPARAPTAPSRRCGPARTSWRQARLHDARSARRDQAAVAETGRIWSIDFSERFEVPAVGKAAELVRAGAIGKVVQTVGLGPHRLNRHTREDWFFERDAYGGVLCDIASHQIDQFLFFTGSDGCRDRRLQRRQFRQSRRSGA
jgi:predicted dehydrogenase